MMTLADNWYLVVCAVVCGAAIGVGVYRFVKLPGTQKIANLKEWLKYAVIEAEKSLGSGTGQLKLRMVYDMAINRFAWVGTFVTFEQFSVWVDDALDWMRAQLDSNKDIYNIVNEEANA